MIPVDGRYCSLHTLQLLRKDQDSGVRGVNFGWMAHGAPTPACIKRKMGKIGKMEKDRERCRKMEKDGTGRSAVNGEWRLENEDK